MKRISTFLWFEREAKDAAEFYCNVFENSRITNENPVIVAFQIEGSDFVALNGGPNHQINPSISFFVHCDSTEEADRMWESLSVNGSVLMPLDKYEWSEKYGWCQDRFGINWQVMFVDTISQKIVPSLMFTGDQSGRAEEAIKFYTSVFQDSEIVEISRYTKEESDVEGTVKYGQFRLAGQDFAAMDSSMAPFSFNDGVSLVVNCDTQEEIDLYWDKFTSEGEEGMCGWLKDKFGVSWQIVPSKMSELMSDPDRAKRVTEAFMKMKKLDLAVLESA